MMVLEGGSDIAESTLSGKVSMGEFTAVNVSRPFLNQNTFAELSGVSFSTLRKASGILWGACAELKMGMTGYTMSMLYFQRLTLLNPSISSEIEKLPSGSRVLVENICCACITAVLLTGERFKKVSDVMEVVHRQNHRTKPTEPTEQTGSPAETSINEENKFVRENISIVNNFQREILETNCFDMTVSSAHRCLIGIAKAVRRPPAKEVVHSAWKLCTDAYETPAVLRFRDHDVAASCLELAIRSQNSEFRGWTHDQKPRTIEWVPLRTTTKYLLEHMRACENRGFTMHSDIKFSDDLKQWLESLERTAPPPHKFQGDTSVWIRDPEATKNGTVRFRVD